MQNILLSTVKYNKSMCVLNSFTLRLDSCKLSDIPYLAVVKDNPHPYLAKFHFYFSIFNVCVRAYPQF